MTLRQSITENITRLREKSSLIVNSQAQIGGYDTADHYFELISKFAQQLEEIDTLFDIRALHFNTLKYLYEKTESGRPELTTNYLGQNLNSNWIKIIALQGYFASSWAIYDTIALIVGRASFTDTIAANPAAYPRLPENIVSDKSKNMGFRMHSLIQKLYAYPILLSYCLRNHLVHESCFKSNDIFKSSNIASLDSFCLNDKFYDSFVEKYKQSNLEKTYSRREVADWDQQNIVRIIELTEAENDEANSILLTWTINAIHNQLELFVTRV